MRGFRGRTASCQGSLFLVTPEGMEVGGGWGGHSLADHRSPHGPRPTSKAFWCVGRGTLTIYNSLRRDEDTTIIFMATETVPLLKPQSGLVQLILCPPSVKAFLFRPPRPQVLAGSRGRTSKNGPAVFRVSGGRAFPCGRPWAMAWAPRPRGSPGRTALQTGR